MDVSLATNCDGASLTFSNVIRFADASGFAQLEQMDQTVRGTARLKPMWEDQYVALTLDRTGHVSVHGLLLEGDQRLEFRFETDQTCLRPLHRAVREWFELAPT